jgi:hypothetical protein
MDKTSAEQLAERGFSLERDVFGQLVLTDADGRQWSGVEPARAFPISCAEEWISLCDAEGHEVLCVRNFDELPPDLRSMLEEELSRREFVPLIKSILRVADDTDPSEWEVETDRGTTTFLLDSEDDVRRLGPYRALFIDTHGIRYLIPDMRKLDAHSRRIMDRYF